MLNIDLPVLLGPECWKSRFSLGLHILHGDIYTLKTLCSIRTYYRLSFLKNLRGLKRVDLVSGLSTELGESMGAVAAEEILG